MASLSVNSVLFPKKSRTVTSIDIYYPSTEKNLRVNLIRDKVISMKGWHVLHVYQFTKALCVLEKSSPYQVCHSLYKREGNSDQTQVLIRNVIFYSK